MPGQALPGIQYKSCVPQSAPFVPKQQNWAFVTCFQLVYSLVNAGMALFVLPLEAERLNGGNGSLWVGIYLSLCGLTQVICPVAGKLSDRHCSEYGRRRPFIVAGTVVAVLAFAVMRMASMMLWPSVYIIFLFLGEMALNVTYAAHCGLPADLRGIEPGCQRPIVKEDHDGDTQGIISGYMSLHSFVGTLIAMGVIVCTRHLDVQAQYPIFIVCLIVCCFTVCSSAKETSTADSSNANVACLSLGDVLASFSIDMNEDQDFFWVCASRMFFYGSISSSVFMYYYLRDLIIPKSSEATIRSALVTMVIISQLVGAICSIPCSRLSNRIGRKVVIYGANALMSVTFTLYMFAPKFVNFAWPIVLVGSTIYGVGAATYLSVDYALALECLPKGNTTAEAFGLWGVAGFLGSSIGPLIGGVLLWLPTGNGSWPGHTAGGVSDEYPYIGYVLVLMFTGPIMNFFGALMIARIQGLEDHPHGVL